ncbi:aldolase [Hortaea werneckii]|nr:aldolase [Hortaea werneckii]KAI7715684.1 aldolase [Hortaea werneckii]
MSQRSSVKAPEPGCYVPAVTFFKPQTDELDLAAQAKYFAYLANTGLKGLVVLGTNAETFLLTREERKALLVTARAAVPKGFPIIAGVGGHSTRQVLEYIEDAREAGSDYVLLLPCAYFGKATTPAVVKAFFDQVAQASALPIVLYNFPAVCNGLDLDSDLIGEIARQNPKIVGVKLTCGSVAKIVRLAAMFKPDRFAVFGGQADFLLGGLAVGSAGCIAAFANAAPRSVAKVFELQKDGKQQEALALQKVLSLAESSTKPGIAAVKYAAAVVTAPRAGISNASRLLEPRRPYDAPTAAVKSRIERDLKDVARLEDGGQMNGGLTQARL